MLWMRESTTSRYDLPSHAIRKTFAVTNDSVTQREFTDLSLDLQTTLLFVNTGGLVMAVTHQSITQPQKKRRHCVYARLDWSYNAPA